MQFHHPELLYALFLLIIPLIVHLFRLRKFQKEDFTNVKFLKKVIKETRKSSRLKKFLILFTRLLLIASLVLAFAQPYFPAINNNLTESKTLIYLDNSLSMQALREQSTLLQKSLNGILKSMPDESNYGLITNNQDYYNRSSSELKKELQELQFTNEQLNLREIQLKAANYFKDSKEVEKELVIISDFQESLDFSSVEKLEDVQYHLVKILPEKISNVKIDSAYIEDLNPEYFSLVITVNSNFKIERPLSISVFNGDKLLGRNTVQNLDGENTLFSFKIQNKEISNGRIEIEDSGLPYDNTLFFSVSANQPVKTVIISDSEASFLKKIYSSPEFETSHFHSDQIDYNLLNSGHLIILNEIENVSSNLSNNLNSFQNTGATIIIIPPLHANSYNEVLNNLGLPSLGEEYKTERLITEIIYDHPLFQGVFEDRTDNFEFPKVISSYNIPSSNAIIKYQDSRAFLIGSNSVYLFTAALNTTNSNFRNSPLIVPVFYQIGLNALKKKQLYYETGKKNSLDIPVKLSNDEVLHLTKPGFDVIPQQQNFSKRVEISTQNISLEAGNYEITNATEVIGNLSFNHDRSESNLQYTSISESSNIKSYDSAEQYFSESNAALQITTLWKWFVIFALIFLTIEMLLIKFFK